MASDGHPEHAFHKQEDALIDWLKSE